MQYLLGGTLTMTQGEGNGSYALATIHQKSFDYIIDKCSNFITDNLQKLLEIDGQLFGYDSSLVKFKLEPPRDLLEEADLQQKESNVKLSKLDSYLKLQQLGLSVDPEVIADDLGIDPKSLTVSEYTPNVVEFDKKKNIVTLRLEQAEKRYNKFRKQMESDFAEWLKNPIKKKLDIDFSDFEKDYIIMYLCGYLDANPNRKIEFADEPTNPFEMPFNEAIKWATALEPKLYEDLETTMSLIEQNVFYIKRSTELHATTKVYDSINKALENGSTYKEWLKDIEPHIAIKAGIAKNGWYSELVYNQNMINAQAAGHYDELTDITDYAPYWEYVGVADDRQTDICRQLDGKIYRFDDPIWASIYPPNHFNCRSMVVALSKEDVGKRAVSRSTKTGIKNVNDDLGNFKGIPSLDKNLTKLEKDVKLLSEQAEKVTDIMQNLVKEPELTEEEKADKKYDELWNQTTYSEEDLKYLRETYLHAQDKDLYGLSAEDRKTGHYISPSEYGDKIKEYMDNKGLRGLISEKEWRNINDYSDIDYIYLNKSRRNGETTGSNVEKNDQIDASLRKLYAGQDFGKIRLIRSINQGDLELMFNSTVPDFTPKVGDIGGDKALQSATIYEKPVFQKRVDLYIYGNDKNKDGGLIIQNSQYVLECEYLMAGQQYKVLSVKTTDTKKIIEVMIRRK